MKRPRVSPPFVENWWGCKVEMPWAYLWNHIGMESFNRGFIIHVSSKWCIEMTFFYETIYFETCTFRFLMVMFHFLKVTIFCRHLGIPTTWSKSKLRLELWYQEFPRSMMLWWLNGLALWLPSLVLTAGRGWVRQGWNVQNVENIHFGPTQSPKCPTGSKNDSTKSDGWNWHGTSWKELIVQL